MTALGTFAPRFAQAGRERLGWWIPRASPGRDRGQGDLPESSVRDSPSRKFALRERTAVCLTPFHLNAWTCDVLILAVFGIRDPQSLFLTSLPSPPIMPFFFLNPSTNNSSPPEVGSARPAVPGSY